VAQVFEQRVVELHERRMAKPATLGSLGVPCAETRCDGGAEREQADRQWQRDDAET
jgi:hypothetical protein